MPLNLLNNRLSIVVQNWGNKYAAIIHEKVRLQMNRKKWLSYKSIIIEALS